MTTYHPRLRRPMERTARGPPGSDAGGPERNRLAELGLSMWNDVMPPQSTVILITSPQLGRSRSDMSYDVAGLGLGGEKKGKRKMYLYAGVAVVVVVIVIVAVWWTYYRM